MTGPDLCFRSLGSDRAFQPTLERCAVLDGLALTCSRDATRTRSQQSVDQEETDGTSGSWCARVD